MEAKGSDEVIGQKRARDAETFIDPSEVTLHCHDFSFDALKASSIIASDQQKGFHEPGGGAVASKNRGEASGFTYYGSICWCSDDESGQQQQVTTFQQLHDLYAAECKRLLTSKTSSKSEANSNEVSRSNQVYDTAPSAHLVAGSPSPWERHYELTTNTFFPIKNYIHRAFPTLLLTDSQEATRRLIMECGCGNGSAVLSFLKNSPRDNYICFDISETAVSLLNNHALTLEFIEKRKHHSNNDSQSTATEPQPLPLLTFSYDICDSVQELDEQYLDALAQKAHPREGCPRRYHKSSVDQLMLIFVLCALPDVPAMQTALSRLAYWLKPGRFVDSEGGRKWSGGRLLFRDYAILDHNMLRFLERPSSNGTSRASYSTAPSNIFFQKGDGTTQFFFEMDFTIALFRSCGFEPLDVAYHCNEVRNRKNGKVMRKVFLNGEFGILDSQT